jgi:hypothetical protein
MVWLLAQKIVVSRGVNPGYRYQIANETANGVVEGRLAGGTGPRQADGKKIVAIFVKMSDTGRVVKEEVLASPVFGEVRVSHTGLAISVSWDDDGRNQKLRCGC